MMLKLKWKALEVGSVSLDYAKQLSLSLSSSAQMRSWSKKMMIMTWIMIMIMVDRNQFMIMTGAVTMIIEDKLDSCCLCCVSLNVFFFVSNLIRFSPLVNFSGSQLNFLETPSSILLFNSQFRFRLSAITTFPVCHHSQAGKMTWKGLLNLIITNKAITKTQI